MMGVQTTCGKRKLEVVTGAADGGGGTPCKAPRWETAPSSGEDCIARLQAVAVPGTTDIWHPTPLIADLDDEDEFEDELSDCEEPARCPPPARFYEYPRTTYWHQQYYPQQQTIRREENGKSYLELGAANTAPAATPRHSPCYRQRRLAVLNLSMCKLARYRQCSDPSLRRSVLICNTLRHIEREMEAEGGGNAPPPPAAAPAPPQQPAPWYPAECAATPPQHPQDLYGLRELTTPSGRVTPFPATPTPQTPASDDSGYDADEGRAINWGSVLSLTAQAGLAEPMNNNELYAELGLTAPDPTPSMHTAGPSDPWDSFMHVLVSGT